MASAPFWNGHPDSCDIVFFRDAAVGGVVKEGVANPATATR